MTAQQDANTKDANVKRVYSVIATDRETGEQVELRLRTTSVAGQGSFGVVVRAEMLKGGSGIVALKRTKQDRRFKNRELQLMLALRHNNIVNLRYYWYQEGKQDDEVFLHLVLEYIPDTLYRVYRSYIKRKKPFPELLGKLYLWQLFRALAFVHAHGCCHRDVKPHNVLVDSDTGRLVLIDFGSAKVLTAGEPNVSYTCSRYYRAPELIFGSTNYSTAVDLWATGCILGELLNGAAFFPGSSSLDQLVEIIKVLGTPTSEQVRAMNPNYLEHGFPQVKRASLAQMLPHASIYAIDLLSALLVYEPTKRFTAIEGLIHPWFDELRAGNLVRLDEAGNEIEGEWALRMPNGREVTVPLFDFSREELSIRPDLIHLYLPTHARAAIERQEGINLVSFEPVDLSTLRIHID